MVCYIEYFVINHGNDWHTLRKLTPQTVGKEEKKGILSENVNRPNVCASEGLRRNVTWADVVRSK